MYDSKEIERIVSKKRKRLIIEFSIILLLIAVTLVLLILNINLVITFICIIAELVLLFAVYKIFDVQSPGVCFSKELRGVNIKEDEYTSRKAYGPGMSWRQVGGRSSPQPFAPNTGANRRSTPPNIRGTVYLLLDDGNVALLSSLYKSHTDLFMEGDELLKYAGTQFPVVLSREMTKQPCPICGEINDMSDDACRKCGLRIIQGGS